MLSKFKKELQQDKEPKNPILESFLNATKFQDIEHVLQAMKEIRETMSPASLYPYAGKYLLDGVPVEPRITNFKKTFQYIRGEINQVENLINKKIFERYDWNSGYDTQLTQFYKPLLDLLTTDTNNIHTVTTNYDQAIENFGMLADQGYSCIDGFRTGEDGRSVWKKEHFNPNYNVGTNKIIF